MRTVGGVYTDLGRDDRRARKVTRREVERPRAEEVKAAVLGFGRTRTATGGVRY
jgi:hypothetical protein